MQGPSTQSWSPRKGVEAQVWCSSRSEEAARARVANERDGTGTRSVFQPELCLLVTTVRHMQCILILGVGHTAVGSLGSS